MEIILLELFGMIIIVSVVQRKRISVNVKRVIINVNTNLNQQREKFILEKQNQHHKHLLIKKEDL